MRRWWAQKYNRPPTDPLYEQYPASQWLREMYEDIYEQIAENERNLEDETTTLRERTSIMARLRKLRKAVGDATKTSDDPLADKWERDLAEGRIPDLDETVE